MGSRKVQNYSPHKKSKISSVEKGCLDARIVEKGHGMGNIDFHTKFFSRILQERYNSIHGLVSKSVSFTLVD